MNKQTAVKTNIKVWARRAGAELSPEQIEVVAKGLKNLGLGNSIVTGPIFAAARHILRPDVPKEHLNSAAYLIARTMRPLLDSSEGYNILKELGRKATEEESKATLAMYSPAMCAAFTKLMYARQESKRISTASMTTKILKKLGNSPK